MLIMESEGRLCRYCFEAGADSSVTGESGVENPSELIAPCDCTGSQEYVHRGCLYTWQITQLTVSLSSRNEERNKHLNCGVCGAALRGVDSPDTVHVIESLVGIEVTRSLSLGSLLVASRRSSEREIPDMNHMLIMLLNMKRAHWKYGVYFIYRYDSDDTANGTVRALNLTRLMDNSTEKPIPDEILMARELYPWMDISHFNGGPVSWSSVRTGVCVLGVATEDIAAAASADDSLIIIPCTEGSAIIVAPFQVLAEYLESHHRDRYTDRKLAVLSFSGYAQWNRLQLLGEINKGSWGVIDADAAIHAEDHCLQGVITGPALWERYHGRAVCAGGGHEDDTPDTTGIAVGEHQ